MVQHLQVNFTKLNSIKHITTAPYHPSCNGLAERAVRIVKQALKSGEGNSIQEKLSKFLELPSTEISPAELLMGRHPRSRLDVISKKKQEG